MMQYSSCQNLDLLDLSQYMNFQKPYVALKLNDKKFDGKV